mmetsp:Transcript_15558/g.23429  ORF Transcript_15558/g.23429 Transcript_15558/m.23429 type:complete len:251 (+) Transcript_15558:1110-1862(+)
MVAQRLDQQKYHHLIMAQSQSPNICHSLEYDSVQQHQIRYRARDGQQVNDNTRKSFLIKFSNLLEYYQVLIVEQRMSHQEDNDEIEYLNHQYDQPKIHFQVLVEQIAYHPKYQAHNQINRNLFYQILKYLTYQILLVYLVVVVYHLFLFQILHPQPHHPSTVYQLIDHLVRNPIDDTDTSQPPGRIVCDRRDELHGDDIRYDMLLLYLYDSQQIMDDHKFQMVKHHQALRRQIHVQHIPILCEIFRFFHP